MDVNTYTYKVDEIFENIPGDPDNVIMKIPPELEKELGWLVDDTINITLDGNSIILSNISHQTLRRINHVY